MLTIQHTNTVSNCPSNQQDSKEYRQLSCRPQDKYNQTENIHTSDFYLETFLLSSVLHMLHDG